MTIRVELFGIPRARAGAAEVSVEGDCLGEVLEELGRQFPAFADECLDNGQLRHGFTANLSGERFVTDPQTQLVAGETLLIMNLDAGG